MTTDDKSDATLVKDVLAGEKDAFSTLVRRYQNYAYGVALGVLADFDLARDVVQEAFLRSCHDLAKLREPERFSGWLGGIVRHTALRAVRELERVKALAFELSQSVESHAPVHSPAHVAEQAEQKLMMHEALRRLPPKNREAVCLHYLSDLSYAEVAHALGVSEATVLGRLQRGRAQLKKELSMIEETFKREGLPKDFAAEVKRLLDTAARSAREREQAIQRLAEIGEPAVDPLVEALPDPRPIIRRVAARALCRIGDARALGPILRALFAGDYWLHNTVFRGGSILHIPGARDELLRIAGEGCSGDQYWAIQALGYAMDDREAWDLLLGVFRNPQANNRGAALGALCRLRPEFACQLIVEGLRDPQIRRLSGYAWWEAFKRGLVPPLNVCLGGFARDVAPNGRFMAALLALRHGEAGIEALQVLLQSGSPLEQEAAALALARAGREEAFGVLLRHLQQGGQETKWGRILARELVRNFTAQLLQWVESERPKLSSHPELAWAVAQAQLVAGQATRADMVDFGSPTVRADALRKLAVESGLAALPQLRRSLADGTPKKLAREAFWQMHALGPAAEPVALEMLDSELWTERKAAICLLRRWGKLTPEQKAQALTDTHVAVRHAAG